MHNYIVHYIDLELLRRGMKNRGIRSYSELAKLAGLHRNTIRHLLKSPSVLPESLERILSILKIPFDQVVVDLSDVREVTQDRLIASIVDPLHTAFPDVTFILFGSRGRGRARRYSDIDIGVYSEKGLSHEDFRKIFRKKCELEEASPIFVDLVHLNVATHDFLATISKDWSFLTGKRGDWESIKRKAMTHER